MIQKIHMFLCAGCKKGKCFPKENTEEVWKHLKSYRKKEEYAHIVLREAACLDMCHFAGPNLLVIGENGKDMAYHMAAKNTEEAKKRIDEIMEGYAANTASFEKGCCGRGCAECVE